LQINELPESDVERAMGIENVEQSMDGSPTTSLAGSTLAGFPLGLNGFAGRVISPRFNDAGSGLGSRWLELDAAVTRT
jgi:hypothetical protein